MTTPVPEGLPLWLRLILGIGPIAAAFIAGTFALANTGTRRIERLKNLADARDKLPSWMNHDHSIDRLIVNELGEIERLSSPLNRWYRRLNWAAYIVFAGLWTIVWLPAVPETIGVSRQLLQWIATGLLLAFVVFSSVTRKRRWRNESSHDLRVGVLDLLEKDRQAKNVNETAEAEQKPEPDSGGSPVTDEGTQPKNRSTDEI